MREWHYIIFGIDQHRRVSIRRPRMLKIHCLNTAQAFPRGLFKRDYMIYIMIQFRTRVFPTSRLQTRIHPMRERVTRHCLACGGNMPRSIIRHIMLEWSRRERHSRDFGTLAAPSIKDLVRQFAIYLH
jgi:hypothetical protein